MRYEQISGLLFAVIALAQLTRALLRLPAEIDGYAIPIWVSVVAFLVTGTLAIWAFRSARRTS
jgi:hypothetical protein